MKLDLPTDVADRLKLQRVVQRHGTETRMFLYHIWDRHQPTLLDYHHFSYGVVYDPVMRYHHTPLLVRFYANRQRIYDKRDVVIPALWEEMRQAEKVLFGFKANQNAQMIGLFREMHPATVEELSEQIFQGFLELIPYWHSRYAAVIDTYGLSLSRADVEDAMSGRKKFQHVGPRSPVARVEYSRHVPARLRAEVISRDGGRCLRCGAVTDLHVDHSREARSLR